MFVSFSPKYSREALNYKSQGSGAEGRRESALKVSFRRYFLQFNQSHRGKECFGIPSGFSAFRLGGAEQISLDTIGWPILF
jgi:hypothetical protein